MTLDQFLRKYNKCPFCRNYRFQGEPCRNCVHYFSTREGKEGYFDHFDPTEEWMNMMNREVDDGK